MTHTRETRAAASEIKFLIDPPLAPRILEWSRQHLDPDPHGTGADGDEYDISTIYFDTAAFDVFSRRGSFARAKYRVRRYNQAPMVYLERKLRKPGLLIKRRTGDAAESLARLDGHLRSQTWRGDWFHRRLLARGLRPACQVSYHRVARTTTAAEGPARLTLDSRLLAVAVDRPHFTADRGVQFLVDRSVLELKYRDRLPAVFRRLIEDFALSTDAASKYRLAMGALGHPFAGRDEGALQHRGIDCTYA
jgi:hypothetical protein